MSKETSTSTATSAPAQVALVQACEKGDLRGIKTALQSGANVNGNVDSNNSSTKALLIFKVLANVRSIGEDAALDIFKLFLDHGADFSILDYSSDTVLSRAVEYCGKNANEKPLFFGVRLIRFLLDEAKVPILRIQEPNEARAKQWKRDCSALELACELGSVPLAHCILEHARNFSLDPLRLMKRLDASHSHSPLYRAIEKNQAAVVLYCVERDRSILSDTNILYHHSRYSPLSLAVQTKAFDVAKLLIDLGADVMQRVYGSSSIFDTILEKGEETRPILLYVLGKYFEGRDIKMKQQKQDRQDDDDDEDESTKHNNCSINAVAPPIVTLDFLARDCTSYNNLPIFSAARGGDLAVFNFVHRETLAQWAEYAVEREIERKRDEEEQAKKIAEENKKKSFFERATDSIGEAIKQKVEDAINDGAQGSFSVTLSRKRQAIRDKREALDLGSVTDGGGSTLLSLAAGKGNLQLCRFLVDVKKFNVNQVDSWGAPPLFEAIKKQHEDVVNFLLDRGADVTFVSRRSESVISAAAESCNLKLMFVAYDRLGAALTMQQQQRDEEHVSLADNKAAAAAPPSEHDQQQKEKAKEALKTLEGYANFRGWPWERTPLMQCLRSYISSGTHQRTAVATFLLHIGANIDLVDSDKKTALAYADSKSPDLRAEANLIRAHRPGQFYPAFECRQLSSVTNVPLFAESSVPPLVLPSRSSPTTGLWGGSGVSYSLPSPATNNSNNNENIGKEEKITLNDVSTSTKIRSKESASQVLDDDIRQAMTITAIAGAIITAYVFTFLRYNLSS